MTSTSEVLQQAAELVERGWTQGVYGRRNGKETGLLRDADCLCVYGAIFVAGRYPSIRDAEDSDASLYLRRSLGQPPHLWNDRHGRTKAEVVAALRAAAALARRDAEGLADTGGGKLSEVFASTNPEQSQ